jgi:hypothetical protein
MLLESIIRSSSRSSKSLPLPRSLMLLQVRVLLRLMEKSFFFCIRKRKLGKNHLYLSTCRGRLLMHPQPYCQLCHVFREKSQWWS